MPCDRHRGSYGIRVNNDEGIVELAAVSLTGMILAAIELTMVLNMQLTYWIIYQYQLY